jgi:hypothetical protein
MNVTAIGKDGKDFDVTSIRKKKRINNHTGLFITIILCLAILVTTIRYIIAKHRWERTKVD